MTEKKNKSQQHNEEFAGESMMIPDSWVAGAMTQAEDSEEASLGMADIPSDETYVDEP